MSKLRTSDNAVQGCAIGICRSAGTMALALVLTTGLLMLAQFPGAAQVVQPPPVSTQLAAPAPSPLTTYILGPDDVILIQVLDVPDLNGKNLRIDPNGDLRMPMVGRIHASGMTVEDLEAEIVQRLKTYLNEPDVAVMVSEFHSQSVSVIGAVRSPGMQQLQGKRTLVEVLSMAGGVAAEAGPVVRIMRRPEWDRLSVPGARVDQATGMSVADIDLKMLLDARSPESNIAIMPNDLISVPRADVAYVIGEVERSGPVPLSRGESVSVLEAVSAAGGVLRTGAPKKARILRANEATQTRSEVNVNLSRIMQGKDRDVALLSGDILVVPDNSGKRITTRAAEAALQFGILVGSWSLIR